MAEGVVRVWLELIIEELSKVIANHHHFKEDVCD